MTPKRIVFLVIALLFATFVFQNAQVVEVRFLFWKTEASRALILLGTFLFGLIVGCLAIWIRKKDRKSSENDNAAQSQGRGIPADGDGEIRK
jgi:putative membrane protein